MRISNNGAPRRIQTDLFTPSETAIREAMLAVECAGCHPLLTETVTLLSQAREKVADFVELPTRAELITYFQSDIGGEGLRPEFLASCSDGQLLRMAELAGDSFSEWLQAQPLATVSEPEHPHATQTARSHRRRAARAHELLSGFLRPRGEEDYLLWQAAYNSLAALEGHPAAETLAKQCAGCVIAMGMEIGHSARERLQDLLDPDETPTCNMKATAMENPDD